MQSRDFEQLCEFMMRVNMTNDSCEGWTESSDTENGSANTMNMCTMISRSVKRTDTHHEPQSLVYDLGRHTVEHWANFAKKASF